MGARQRGVTSFHTFPAHSKKKKKRISSSRDSFEREQEFPLPSLVVHLRKGSVKKIPSSPTGATLRTIAKTNRSAALTQLLDEDFYFHRSQVGRKRSRMNKHQAHKNRIIMHLAPQQLTTPKQKWSSGCFRKPVYWRLRGSCPVREC